MPNNQTSAFSFQSSDNTKKESDDRRLTTNDSHGFTIIEVLVAIGVIAVIGVALAGLLAQSFSNSAKTQTIGMIKQNGQSTLNTIDQSIRMANNIVCVGTSVAGTTGDTLVIKSKNSYMRWRITGEKASPPTNGIIQADSPIALENRTPVGDPNNTGIYCTESLTSPKGLTDNLSVSVKSGEFKLIGTNVINVSFKLGPLINASKRIEYGIGDVGGIEFKTTVEVR